MVVKSYRHDIVNAVIIVFIINACFVLLANTLGCLHERQIFENLTTGNITDGPGHYFSDQRCEWLIVNPDPLNYPYITLTFTEKNTECLFDYVMVFNGDSYTSELLATLSGDTSTTPLPQITTKSTHVLIYLFSDHNYELSGFAARFDIYACPNNCSSKGRCLHNWCQCDNFWSGSDCSVPICPDSCSGHQGTCDLQSTKRCTCNDGYIGIGCGLAKQGYTQPDTWKLVYNYTDNIHSTSLAGHAGAYVDPHLWIFGGYDLNNISNKLLRYDFQKNEWESIYSQHLPPPRYYHTMSSLREDSNSYLLIFGGETGVELFSDELWIYDISHSMWSLHDNNLKGTLHPLAQHATAVVDLDGEKYIYVFGGRAMTDSESVFSSELFRFHWRTRMWKKIDYDPAAGVQSMSLKLAGHSMVFDEVSGSLVVFGGYQYITNTSAQRSSKLYLYDLTRQFWVELPTQESVQARAFHTASIIGDFMIVFGGSIHLHNTDESCHSDVMRLYNLRCNSWDVIAYRPNTRPTGRFSHIAAASRDHNLLFVHGGYDGTVLNQLFAYRVPMYAMDNIELNAIHICERYARSSCLMDQRCVWCSGDLMCRSRNETSPGNYHEMGSFIKPSCPGFCNAMDTCSSCSIFQNYQLDSDNQWQTVQCEWCVPDIKCYQTGQLEMADMQNSKCSVTNSDMWWGMMNNNMIATTSLCVESNTPPGILTTYYYNNANLTSPDKVIFVKSEFDFHISQSSSPPGNHIVVMEGFLHALHPSQPLAQLQMKFFFETGNCRGSFHLSMDEHRSDDELILFTNGSVMFDSTESPLVTRSLNTARKYYYKVTVSFIKQELNNVNVALNWKARNWVSGDKNFSPINLDLLEPYHSPTVANACGSYRDCMACLTDFSCSWCVGMNQCVSRHALVTSNSPMCDPRNYSSMIRGDGRFFGVIVQPASCPSCADRDNCHACLSDGLCMWNKSDSTLYRGCKSKNYFTSDVGVSSINECPSLCSERSTCGECVGDAGTCSWCSNTQTCYDFKNHRLINGMGQCTLFTQEIEQCINCSALTSCKECVKEFQCGWCGVDSSPFEGSCVEGDYAGSIDYQNCPVGLSNDTVSYEWQYSECDVDECIMEWPIGSRLHNCHMNASCSDTQSSFTCTCNPGFNGDGVTCNRTCVKQCMHGTCSGPPHYRCLCNLGWTADPISDSNDDCNVDCQCNFYSTCVTGIGECDHCHNNTRGSHCDECLPEYFGNATDSVGCIACQCSGHGDPSRGLCHPNTGRCFCLHNTWGNNCEKCMPNFYGDPRNSGVCYHQCMGRTLYSDQNQTGAFGSWNKARIGRHQSTDVYCMWIISTHESNTIKLNINRNLDVNCLVDRMLIYDGIPSTANQSNLTTLASLCGGVMDDDLTLYAKSGHITVLYQTSQKYNVSLGFNVTYQILYNGSDTYQHRSGDFCPNNCSISQRHGQCVNAVCHCSDGYASEDCGISSSNLRTPSYWKLEYNLQFYQMANKGISVSNTSLPQASFGHSLVADGTDLWLFGGYSYSGMISKLHRYDTIGKEWHAAPTTDASPSARYMHASVASQHHRRMLMHGGMLNNGSTSNEMWELHWKGSSQPIGWTQVHSNLLLPQVAGHTLTLCRRSITILIGGYSQLHSFNTKLWAYNITTRIWSMLGQQGAKFVGVYGHSTTYDRITDFVYVFGGMRYDYSGTDGTRPSNSLYVYNLNLERWSILSNSGDAISILSPPPSYFHTAVSYYDGENRGFLLIGGKTDTNNFTNDVWLFRYDCRVWTNLNDKPRGVGVFHQPSIGAASSATVVYDITNPSLSTYYVYGGNSNGVLQSALQVVNVLSPCFSATTKCECQLMKAGCTLCSSDNDNTENICLPRNASVSECDIAKNTATRNEEQVSTTPVCSSCSVSSFDISSCPDVLLTNEACAEVDCSQFTSCGQCESYLPSRQRSYCKWCPTSCDVPQYGYCRPAGASCNETACRQVESGCQSCSAVDCDSCNDRPSLCHWDRFDHRHLGSNFTQLCYHTGDLVKLNMFPFPYFPAMPMATKRRPFMAACTSPCSAHLDCDSCLRSLGGKEGGPSICLWSSALGICMSPIYAGIRCVDGSCGHIDLPPASQCPVATCSSITYCHTCLQQRSCGWYALDDNSGQGLCTEGTFEGAVNAQTSSVNRDWYFMQCPSENECTNGHHTCIASSPHYEVCVDQQNGFTCNCMTGYARTTQDQLCQPVCTPDCEHGGCVRPGVCQCWFGYTGPSCQVQCRCNGHSNCESMDNPGNCTQCMNNTQGEHCQYCQGGYVGDPSSQTQDRPCIPCSEICNSRSDFCISSSDASDFTYPSSHFARSGGEEKSGSPLPGPTSVSDTTCIGCTGNSEGRLCEDCFIGYFLLGGDCRKCECNGHGETCDKLTGGSCDCWNNTKSSNTQCEAADAGGNGGSSSNTPPDGCWRHQCDVCLSNFKGTPSNGGQCYHQVKLSSEFCFDPSFKSGCLSSDYAGRAQLPVGKTALFALVPHFTNVDIRLLIEVTEGEIDVYIADNDAMFDIRVDSRTGEHRVVVKSSTGNAYPDSTPYQSNNTRKRRSPSVTSSLVVVTDDTYSTKDDRKVRVADGSGFNRYVSFIPHEALHVTGVQHRLVVICQYSGYNYKKFADMSFYIILLARKPSQPAPVMSDVAPSSRQRRNAGVPVVTASSGRILFRQDQTRIDLFVFFSVFFSCFFLFLSICILAWKIKQAVDTQQARLAHHIQLQHMASRPFTYTFVYFDKQPVQLPQPSYYQQIKPAASDKTSQSPSPVITASSKSERQGTPRKFPRRIFMTSAVKPASSDGSISEGQRSTGQAFSPSSSKSLYEYLPSPIRHKRLEVVKRPNTGAPLDLVPEVTYASSRGGRRHSDNLDQLEKWAEAEKVHKRNLVVHCRSSDILEHRIPLLHTTSEYLTVITDVDGNSRLTPDAEPRDLVPVSTSSERLDSKHLHPKNVFRHSLDVRFHPDANGPEIDCNDVTIARSASTPVLTTKPAAIFSSSTSVLPKTSSRASPRVSSRGKTSTREKYKLSRRRSCPINIGPVAFEPTEDLLAGVATVILQLPGGNDIPYSACLGSSLVTSKNMNLPLSQDSNPTKVRCKIAITKHY